MKKFTWILVAGLFAFFFATAGICADTAEEAPAAEPTVQIQGTIDQINQDTGQVGIKAASGEMIMLTASSDLDLKDFFEGDSVNVECTSDRIIQSITKETKSDQ